MLGEHLEILSILEYVFYLEFQIPRPYRIWIYIMCSMYKRSFSYTMQQHGVIIESQSITIDQIILSQSYFLKYFFNSKKVRGSLAR